MRKLWILLALWCVLVALVVARENSGPPGGKAAVRMVTENLRSIASVLKDHAARTGAYPTNDEGLSAFVKKQGEGEIPEDYAFSVAALNERRRDHLRPVPGGIQVWGGVPIVYENRRGLPEEKFTGSPAADGIGKPWCVAVDEGVYLYSLPGRLMHGRLTRARNTTLTYGIPLAVAAVLFAAFAIRLTVKRRSAERTPKTAPHVSVLNWLLGIGLVLAGLVCGLGPMMVFACYPGTVLRMHRNFAAAQEYADLLDEFHARGVIRDETYRKLKEASGNDKWHRWY